MKKITIHNKEIEVGFHFDDELDLWLVKSDGTAEFWSDHSQEWKVFPGPPEYLVTWFENSQYIAI